MTEGPARGPEPFSLLGRFSFFTGEIAMSELKPKHDDQMASGAPKKTPQPSTETKPHGDKLQSAFDAAKDDPKQKSK